MRAQIRNSVAAALAAAIAFSGAPAAQAATEVELAPIATNTANLVDSDNDGLPDIWEKEGVVLKDGTAIPLPDWGADPNRPDIYLQLNWMASEYDTLNCDTQQLQDCAWANRASYAPTTRALDELVDLFDAHGINLHIDAGSHYTNIPNYKDRSGGETLEFRPVYFDTSRHEGIQLVETVQNLGDRANIFRPGVIGDRMRAGSNTTGLSLVGDNSFYVANPGGRATEQQLRNTILHEFGHTLGLRHWGGQDYTYDIAERSPMQDGYRSVMNYDHQFDLFNYSEQAYFADTPAGKRLVPADWDVLMLDNARIGAYADTIGARINPADLEAAEVEVEQPEVSVEVEKPQPVEVADNTTAALAGETPADAKPKAEQVKAEKAEKAQPVKAEHVKAEKAQPAKADGPNVAAIIGGIVAALAILGIGAGVFAMM